MRKIKNSRRSNVEASNKRGKYTELMQRLVKTIMHTDVQNSLQDDFRDLRKDKETQKKIFDRKNEKQNYKI